MDMENLRTIAKAVASDMEHGKSFLEAFYARTKELGIKLDAENRGIFLHLVGSFVYK